MTSNIKKGNGNINLLVDQISNSLHIEERNISEHEEERTKPFEGPTRATKQELSLEMQWEQLGTPAGERGWSKPWPELSYRVLPWSMHAMAPCHRTHIPRSPSAKHAWHGALPRSAPASEPCHIPTQSTHARWREAFIFPQLLLFLNELTYYLMICIT